MYGYVLVSVYIVSIRADCTEFVAMCSSYQCIHLLYLVLDVDRCPLNSFGKATVGETCIVSFCTVSVLERQLECV